MQEKLFKKFIKNKYERSKSYTHKRESIYLWPSTYMQDKKEIPSIVNEKIVEIFTLWVRLPHF